MKLFGGEPADEVANVRRSLDATRQRLAVAQSRVADARTEHRRALAAGADPTSAEAALEAARADADLLVAREAELSAALEEAEGRAAEALKAADFEALVAQARAAKKEGERVAPEMVQALRSFVLAWGRVEAARETVDYCDRFARRHFGKDLGVTAVLPDRYQLVPLAAGDLTGGRFVREELPDIGFFVPAK